MSYDIELKSPACSACGRDEQHERVEHNSPTYNFGRMIREADRLAGGEGCSFAAIDGRTGMDAVRWFRLIRHALVDHRAVIEPLEPENGWGTYEDLLRIFTAYIQQCEMFPSAVWAQMGDGGRRMRCAAGWMCGEAREGEQ